uniref:MinD/ParA family ATP-binding protein n=1 Tax=Nocardia colli TaxID=2545717 RepID=UPI001CC3B735|nr:MinD/ParA family protein [Nocardia colli]
MSRNNDGLPMLPPWLSESDVTQVGYEAPVQNLPSDDVIDDGPSQRRPDRRGKRWRRDKNDRRGADGQSNEPSQRAPESAPRTPDSPQHEGPRDDPWRQSGLDAYVQPRPDDAWQAGPPQRGEAPAQRTEAPHQRAEAPRTEAPAQALPTRNPGPPLPAFQPLGRRPAAAEPSVSNDAAPRTPANRPELPPPPALPDPPPQASTATPDAPTRTPQAPAERAPESTPAPQAPPQRAPESIPPTHAPVQRAPESSGPPPWLAGPRPEQPTRSEQPTPPAPPQRRPPLPDPPPPQGDRPAAPTAEQTPPARLETPTAPPRGVEGPPQREQAPSPQSAAQRPGPATPPATPDRPGPHAPGERPSAATTPEPPTRAPFAPPAAEQGAAPGPSPEQAPNRAPAGSSIPPEQGPPPTDPLRAPQSDRPYGPAPEQGPNGAAGPQLSGWPTGPSTSGVTERPESGPQQRDSGRQPDWVPSSNAGAGRTSSSGRHRLPSEIEMQQGAVDESGRQAPPQNGPVQQPGPYAQTGTVGPTGHTPPTIGQAPSSEQPGPQAPAEPWRNAAAPVWADETPTRTTPPVGGPAPGSEQPGPQAPGEPWRNQAPPDENATRTPPFTGGQAPGSEQPEAPHRATGGFAGPQVGGQAPGGVAPAPPAHPGQWGRPPVPQGGQYQPGVQYQSGPPPSLDDVPMRRAKKSPGSGWRKAVHHVSGGAINPGLSAEELRLQELVARIRQPVRGDYRIATLSLKGGVGKTTTTMGIGSIFASIRGDRVIAVDANPDFGTLSQRVPLQTRSTVRDLLLDPSIQRYSDVRRHTSQATSRLEVLASERDPAASEAFSEEEYRAVARILQRFYNIILTDCGTGLMHSAMSGVLDLAHSLVLISSPAIDGARSAAATLDWLSLHGHDHLVRNAVVVINSPRAGSPNVGIQQLREYFLSRCRAVHIIPFDPHMSEGAEIDLHRLHKQTKRAYVELAATIADDFATDHRRYQP